MPLSLDSGVAELAGVGQSVAGKLKRLGIETARDLIFYYPRRYDDFSKLTPIAKLKPGPVTVKGKILRAATRRTHRRGFSVTEAIIDDGGAALKAVWFNQPYLAKSLPLGIEVYAAGQLEFKYSQYALQNPVIERVSSFPKDTARIVPVYAETKDLTSRQIRKLIAQILPLIKSLPELLPSSIFQGRALEGRAEALRQIHFPDSAVKLAQARHRLAFEELFVLILTSLVIKSEVQTESSPQIAIDEKLAQAFVKSLEFKLTDAQRKAAWRILQDLAQPTPMNRLLEGDVGSGKTVVATLAAMMAVKAGYQVALLAPTEILARQHAATLGKLIKNFDLRTNVLLGSTKLQEKGQILAATKNGDSQIIIGTHALLGEKVYFKNLGLVIVDEQHRFGVNQRNALKAKAGKLPHLLSMSATPIPRSLALTIYGDLDISIIDELPPGRKPVKTKLATTSERAQVYKRIDEQITAGRQVYVICPLISDSDSLGVKSVEAEAARLKNSLFRHRQMGVLHGRMKADEKEAVMQGFNQGKIDMLVSTTVVEVGVDVPNASVMLIEGAERFGLAQLHQLRGRVGRAEHQSYCYIVASQDQQAQYRLELLERFNDGFSLAQKDLEIRGPGQIYGLRQHGLLDLRLADLSDTKMIAEARQSAQDFLATEKLAQHPDLLEEVNKLKTITRLD